MLLKNHLLCILMFFCVVNCLVLYCILATRQDGALFCGFYDSITLILFLLFSL